MSEKKELPVARTSLQELPTQIVMDFFKTGIPITSAPKDVVLKKSNAAIKVISALGLLERKIIDACVFVASSKMNESHLHTADIDYFKWLLSFNSNNHSHLKKAITNIQQTLIQINIIDEANPSKDFWHSTNFLYDVSISGGKIFFRIPESIRQPLMDPKTWTYLSFRIKNRFTSEYAYVIYERCRADQFKGATDWWTIPQFRDITNTQDLYDKFQDLQKRVIKLAVEQINELSDIYITPDYQTRGRTKTHIRFIIEENPNVVQITDDKDKLPDVIFEELKSFGLSNSQIDQAAEYPLETLIAKIDFTKHRIKNSKKKIDRPDAYFMKALKEDLRFNNVELELFQTETSKKVKASEEKANDEEQQQKRKKNDRELELFQALSADEQNILIDEYKRSPFYAPIAKTMKDKAFSLKSPLIRVNFLTFLKEGYAGDKE
jgi:plasmid replication initiation protein